jgi:hypothetical protein
MAAKLTRLTQKITIQLHLVANSCTVFSYSSRRPVRKLLDTPSYAVFPFNLSMNNAKNETTKYIYGLMTITRSVIPNFSCGGRMFFNVLTYLHIERKSF